MTSGKQATTEMRAAFGRTLLKLMTERGWNQSELARQAELGRDCISGYVRAKNFPNKRHLLRLAGAFGMTPEELLQLPDGMNREQHEEAVPQQSVPGAKITRSAPAEATKPPSKDHGIRRLLTSNDVAYILNGISIRTVDRLRASGNLEFTRVRGHVRYAPQQVEDYLISARLHTLNAEMLNGFGISAQRIAEDKKRLQFIHDAERGREIARKVKRAEELRAKRKREEADAKLPAAPKDDDKKDQKE